MRLKQYFRNQPIQRKVLLITLSICAVVLIIAVMAMFSLQILNFHAGFKNDVATLADIVADNATAALSFEDRRAAREIIGSLRARPAVECACLANSRGDVIAHFGDVDDLAELGQFPVDRGFRFVGGSLLYTAPVELDGKLIGRLYLRTDYRKGLLQLVRFYSFIVVIILAVSAMLALWLSERLGRLITRPLLSLTETVRAVGEKNDYSVRSDVSGRSDELGTLSTAFNRMLERIQTQDSALTISQQKLESLINSIDGIVWEWDPNSFEFTFVSEQSRRILGYAPELWLASPKFWDEIVHPDDAEKALNACLEAIAKRQPYHCEYRVIAADKRVVWIRESAIVLVKEGTPFAFRGIFQDITEHKKAAEELERLNRRLVDASRQAGMAEVATGVLHNVGNVLNSVNVSATLLHDQMEKSKLDSLQKATGVLRQHLPELPTYISADPKGKLLPDFIIKVSDALASEQGRWREELKGLKKNIEHMKEIVAMQQSYARVSGVIESLDAKELLEDALQINIAGLTRHGVMVLRIYNSVPKVNVDKHKVMQILINLIRNAKYALDAAPAGDKKLTLHIGVSGADRVRITVSDNGVGIPKENLTKIFSHGFTTKKDGHGFGLHSGAIAAKELGGSLIAESEGPGKGATFALELPTVNSNN